MEDLFKFNQNLDQMVLQIPELKKDIQEFDFDVAFENLVQEVQPIFEAKPD